MGTVKRRALDHNGKAAGTYHDNPFLNTMVYKVELNEGQLREYSANVIAENMLSQVDSDGFSLTLMDAIIDYRCTNTAIDKKDGYVYTKSGQKRKQKTTAGWELLVKWKDESETWIRLVDMKESHPIEVAEFAVAQGIEDEPAFAW